MTWFGTTLDECGGGVPCARGRYIIFIDDEETRCPNTADEATLGAIAERYGMEILRPVPEGYL